MSFSEDKDISNFSRIVEKEREGRKEEGKKHGERKYEEEGKESRREEVRSNEKERNTEKERKEEVRKEEGSILNMKVEDLLSQRRFFAIGQRAHLEEIRDIVDKLDDLYFFPIILAGYYFEIEGDQDISSEFSVEIKKDWEYYEAMAFFYLSLLEGNFEELSQILYVAIKERLPLSDFELPLWALGINAPSKECAADYGDADLRGDPVFVKTARKLAGIDD